MLVLSRKVYEEIVINSDIKIRVTNIDNDKVRIGIEAPSYIPIMRAELLDSGDDSDE